MKPFRSGRGLLALFVTSILVPGALLVLFGVRGLLQERRLAEQEVRERLEAAAEEIERNLQLELARWQQWVDHVALDSGELSESQRNQLRELGHSVVWHDGATWPRSELLYSVDDPEQVSAPLPAAFAETEALELRGKALADAASRYDGLLETLDSRFRPILLHRLARTHRKMGQLDRALHYYEDLQKLSGARIGELPVKLVALFERASILEQSGRVAEAAAAGLELYRLLVEGKWRLERSRYLYYTEESRARAARDVRHSGELAELRATEQEKLALTEAVAQLVAEPRRALQGSNGVYLSFWRAEPAESAVLIVGPQADLCGRVLGSLPLERYGAEVTAPGGLLVYSPRPPDREAQFAARSVADGDFAWQVRVWPADPAALYQEIGWRRNLYLALVVLVVTLLAFGGYFTIRMVRREVEVVRLKSDFVSAVSHEFRSPLTGIRQLAEMLERGRVPDEQKRQRYYGLIKRESDRLGRLVENLLDFARMEEGKREYRFEPIETATWLRKVAAEFHGELSGRQVRIETSVPDDLPPIEADREALATAIVNLLDNAVKYSSEPATVWFDAAAGGRELTIRVRDRGIGIPEADQPYVFEKFFRSTSNGSHAKKGTGLGLSLVQHIVAAHGGWVDFESRPGEGSTFSIHLKVSS